MTVKIPKVRDGRAGDISIGTGATVREEDPEPGSRIAVADI